MIATHRGAFEYDWRARFHLSLEVVGESMSCGEAVRLTQQLGRDTSSHVCAAVADWQYPAARDVLALLDQYDAFAQVNFKKPKPYPRPWDPAPKRLGSARLTVSQLRAILDSHRSEVARG